MHITSCKRLQRIACLAQNMDNVTAIVRDGGVIVFPTDTVYGIGCDPYCAPAVNRIYKIKNRDASKPLPVLGHSVEGLQGLVVFDERACRLAARFWPGRLTMILRLCDSHDVIASSLRISDRLAVRVPSGRCISDILARCGMMTGTSANRSSSAPCVDPDICMNTLAGADALIDGGIISGGVESTILDLCSRSPRIIRSGAIPDEEILKFL